MASYNNNNSNDGSRTMSLLRSSLAANPKLYLPNIIKKFETYSLLLLIAPVTIQIFIPYYPIVGNQL